VERDWYPSVKPQNSSPPYVLNVTDDEGRSVHEDRFNDGPLYGPGQRTYTISLNGTHTGNGTEKFVGFMIYVYNQFEDEESGHFVKPLPEGVSMTECHLNARSYINEVVQNSTNNQEWSSFQIKWKSPTKYPAGKITLSASVVKEHGVYWDGISLTLNYVCPTPGCYLPGGCPHGLARTKFGCITCECAGAAGLTVQFTSTLLIMLTLFYNLV